jgi:hypothetical protein
MKGIERNKKAHQLIAASLIIMSFLLYAIMPLNAYLPYSARTIAGITGAMIITSEIVFWIGSLMIGREVALRIRKKFSLVRICNNMKTQRRRK